VTRAVEFQNPQRLPISGFGEVSDVAWIACGPPGASAPAQAAAVAAALADLDADPARRDRYVLVDLGPILGARLQSAHGPDGAATDAPALHALTDRSIEDLLAAIRHLYAAAGDRIQGLRVTATAASLAPGEYTGGETAGAPAAVSGANQDAVIPSERSEPTPPAVAGYVAREGGSRNLAVDVNSNPLTTFLLPCYRKLFDAIHECGWHVWMGCDAPMVAHIPDLIDAGCDVLSLPQPRGRHRGDRPPLRRPRHLRVGLRPRADPARR
jgi:hypothetical protein